VPAPAKLFKLNKPVGDNEALNILLVLKSIGYALVVPKKSPEDAAIPREDHLVSVCEKMVVVKPRNNKVKVDFIFILIIWKICYLC
jgi:hypothetical protein